MEAEKKAWLRFLKLEKGVSGRTLDAYTRDITRYLAFLADRFRITDPGGVTLDHIETFLEELSGMDLDPATIARNISSIRGFHGFLMGDGLATANPAELVDLSALERARPDSAAFERLVQAGAAAGYVHLYVRLDPPGTDEVAIRARMFAPLDGVAEDPATGSANCALAGLLAGLDPDPDGAFAWPIAQGVEMGRPSLLEARARKVDGQVSDVWIGGESVLVSEGTITV